jgi:hypothetical protein
MQAQETQDPMGDASDIIERACRELDWPMVTGWVAAWIDEQYRTWTQAPEKMLLLDFQAMLTALQDMTTGEPLASVENRLAHHIDRMGRKVPAVAY